MVKYTLTLLLFIPILLFGQEDNPSVLKPGLVRAQGTFCFGKLPKLKESGIYLHGNLEYYLKSHLSFRGDIFYHLKSDEFSVIKINHQLFSGVSYHIKTGNNFNPYIGIEPGVGLTQASDINDVKQSKSTTFLYSSVIGFNYYAEDWFHLFVDARFLGGNHKAETKININEIRLSFGLGFNINTK